MQCVQDPSQRNVDNLNNARHEDGRHLWNKKKEYLKAKIDELVTNSNKKMSETCIGASVILRTVTNLELI
jgi:hypothetical protein